MPEVSIIIPTYRRAHLIGRSIASVLAQTYGDFEILVVVDGRDDDGSTAAVVDAFADPRLRLLETGEKAGPAAARNHGVAQAAGRYIALLDDDDEWRADKLLQQLALLRSAALEDREFLVSSRIEERVVRQGAVRSYIRPSQLYQPGTDFSAYLLDRPSPLGRPGMVASGTLLFPRSLALRVPFTHDEVHEDWTWLLLCVVRDGVPLLMCEAPLFVYHLDLDALSRSRRLNWRASVAWAKRNHPLLSHAAMAGFVASTVAMRAKRNAGWPAFLELARLLAGECHASGRHWLMLLGVFALPPDLGEYWRRLTFSRG
jgi:glycosyltransferase involved in cell wall biosynthesis